MIGSRRTRADQPAGRRACRWLRVAACWAAGLAAATEAADPKPGRPESPRSPPPAGTWHEATAGTFERNAFETLTGPRPDFAAGRSAPRPGAAGGDRSAPPDGTATAGGFKWSALLSEDTLTDEVKEMKGVIATVTAKPTDFKGGGFRDAHVAFGSLALVFGVIADHDQDVRWKKQAVASRDLFARVGFNCKVGTDQSFAESRARLEDLEALLDGNTPRGTPERDEDFRWSQVAGRPALMKRLEQMLQAARPAITSRGDFDRGLDALRHAVELTAAIGEVIQRPDFEYHDDDVYRGHAAAMRDAAVEARSACEKRDYEAARAAVGRMEKSCDACHGDYRS